MNEFATRKSARRVPSDRSRLAPRRRGGANSPTHRRLLLEPLEDRTLLSAGDLDPTFGDGGLVTTDFGLSPGRDYGYDVVATQADGKIVVVGSAALPGTAGSSNFALARYNSDGTLDTSFGTGGRVTTDFYGSSDSAAAVAVDAEGKIVVAGYARASSTGDDFALARYNSDGSLDTTFDYDGKVTTDFGSTSDRAYGVAIDADGKIVLVGHSYHTGFDFALARYNSDGSLDASFGTGGKVITELGGGSGDFAEAVALDEASRIVVAGYSNRGVATGSDFALARYNPNGSLDTTFDGDGKVITDFDSDYDYAYDVAIDEAGQIVVAGHSRQPALVSVVARYNTNGSLDTTFDAVEHDGMVTIDLEFASGMAIDADGKIVVVGRSDQGVTGYDDDFALARLNSDGSLDNSFGTGGKVTTDFGSNSERAYGVAIDADGKILVAGVSNQRDPTDFDFALARYNNDGSLDTSFDGDGKVITDIGAPGTTDYGRDLVAVQPDGKIVVVGTSGQGSTTGDDFALARYNSDGSLDTTFGTGGKVTTDFYQSSGDYASAVAIDGDGKIVVAGYSARCGSTTSSDFALARYNSDGSLDTSFGDGGLVTTDFAGWSDHARGVAIYPDVNGAHDGKIVVAGSCGTNAGHDFALARYNTDGSLDTSFDTDGKVTTDFGSHTDVAFGVAIDLAGKIVVAGESNQSDTGQDFALARYNSSDGSLDTTFDGDGKVTTHFGSGIDCGRGVAIDADGKIVVVGYSHQFGNTSYDFALARYNSSDGSLDTTFDTDGKITADFGSGRELAYGVAIDPAGKIVVVGHTYQRGGADFALTRYNNSDGSVDTTFGNGGLVTTDFGSDYDFAEAVVIDGDGKIVVVGYSYWCDTHYNFALTRYDADLGVGPITAPADPVEVNTEITASAIFTDRHVTRTHTALWDWGDNTTSPGTVTEPTTEDPGTVTDSHTYTAPGVYTITLTVNAWADGTVVDSDQAVYRYVVAVDASAGFVSGAGLFDSPPGAYVPDPSLNGRARFGFVSKYQKGAHTPDGAALFRFKTADLDFRSSSYQWLVLAGSKAKFKGTGTIGGEGDYGFLITATDGQADGGDGVDKFRIKIWDRATDAIVYDNQLGEPDDSHAGTAISAGNIIVHDGGDALYAVGGTSAGIVGATLAQATLTPVVEQAMCYWAGRGVGADSLAELAAIDVRVADLAPSVLGVASSSNLIWIDRDAAGYGWNDPLGAVGSPAAGMDLLSVVTHELGHKLGFDHGDEHDVMAATLVPGVRTLATAASLQENVFAVQHAHSLAVEPSSSSRNVPLWFPRGTASFQTLHTESVPAEKSQAVRTRDEFFHALALDEDQAAAVDGRLRDDVDHEIAMETIGDLSEFLADAIGQEEPEDEAQDTLPGEDVVEMLALGL